MRTVKLFSMPNQAMASMLQGILQGEGIDSYTKSNMIYDTKTDVFVYENAYTRAMEILKEGFPDLFSEEGE